MHTLVMRVTFDAARSITCVSFPMEAGSRSVLAEDIAEGNTYGALSVAGFSNTADKNVPLAIVRTGDGDRLNIDPLVRNDKHRRAYGEYHFKSRMKNLTRVIEKESIGKTHEEIYSIGAWKFVFCRLRGAQPAQARLDHVISGGSNKQTRRGM